MELNLVTATGAAEILGGKWTRHMVNMYMIRKRFPEPVSTLNQGLTATQAKVWRREQIEEFKKGKGMEKV